MTHKGTCKLETERLILRQFRQGEEDAIFENWASDAEVTKYLSWPTHTSSEVSKMVLDSWVEGYGKDDFYLWAISLKDRGGDPIGSISVVAQDDAIGKVEIGYCIGKRWWHQGIMTEALEAVMSFLFEQVGAQRIEACHDPRNPHSGDVMRKCGMEYEGTLRRSGRNNQGICDVCWYAALSL
ncbi:MAG: GNAT family N-acetyltransferase [Oscillospiraceae bacterium]|nr:GNAT family N-acetyltransferase [Oscillospiraceae bacterium]